MNPDTFSLSADWLVSTTAAPVRNGAVVIRDFKVVGFGPAEEVLASPDVPEILAHADIITPGLVNCHTHLDYSWAATESLPADFTDWIPELIKKTQDLDDKAWKAAVLDGIAQCLAHGVTAVIDIDSLGFSFPLLIDSSMRGYSLLELISTAPDDWPTVRHRLGDRRRVGLVNTGYAPHSPYAMAFEDLQRLHRLRREKPALTAIHIAESASERKWLEAGRGPIKTMLEMIGAAQTMPSRVSRSSVQLIKDAGLLDDSTLLIHCVDIDDQDRALIAESRASVVICPRSNRRLGVGLPDISAMLDSHINIVVGTDSLGSSPDLSILNELRFIRQNYPDITDAQIFAMATANASRFFPAAAPDNRKEPGMDADLVLWSVDSGFGDPLKALLDKEAAVECRHTVINGRMLF